MKAITLIEIIVALAISSVIILAAYNLFNVSLVTWDFGTSNMALSEGAITIMDKFSELLKFNRLSLKEWHFKDKYVKLPDDIGDPATSFFLPSGDPIAFGFKNAVFIPFYDKSEIKENSYIYGIYFENVSREVFIYKNHVNENEIRDYEIIKLSENIDTFEVYYYDINWNTVEINGNLQIFDRDNIKGIKFIVESNTNKSQNYLERTFVFDYE